jgi:hypothetical protein
VPVGVALNRRYCVLEIFTGTGLLEFIEIFVVVAVLVSFVLTRTSSHEVSALKKENHRLRNILADLMIDNANLKGAK